MITRFLIGDAVVWSRLSRGGYGYVVPVNGIVRRIGIKRVKIAVELKTGETVERWVNPDHLNHRALGGSLPPRRPCVSGR